MSNEKVKEALSKLDINNDNHWTTGGEPRIDTVKFLSGLQDVNRDTINSAAPGFNRELAKNNPDVVGTLLAAGAPVVTTPGATLTEPVKTAPAADTQAQQLAVTGDDAEDGTGDKPEEAGEQEGEADAADLEREIAARKAELEELLLKRNDLDNEIAAHQINLDTLIDAHTELTSAKGSQNAISDYLRSQSEVRQKKGEAIKAIRESGLDLKSISKVLSKAPIDQRKK